MKDKIIMFVVGLLVGAIISTGSIYFYTVANGSNNNAQQNMQMPNGAPPNNQSGGNGQPPSMPNGNTIPSGNQMSTN